MNSITLTGRATRDLELRYTSNGKAVANGSIAVQRKFKNANGDYEADFIDFVIWGKGAEIMVQYVKKGDQFGISGALQTRTYENNEGRNVKVTEVNVSDFDFPVKSKEQNNNTQNNNDPFDGAEISDSDLPF